MPIRVRRQLRGADGGKHPHTKNCQDFAVQTIPHPRLFRINARIAYNVLRGHVGKLNEADEQALAAVLVALARVGGG